ncbi:hypothetical protein [Capnocytophaga leadbetteri]
MKSDIDTKKESPLIGYQTSAEPHKKGSTLLDNTPNTFVSIIIAIVIITLLVFIFL